MNRIINFILLDLFKNLIIYFKIMNNNNTNIIY
jgi:hypothetical protein